MVKNKKHLGYKLLSDYKFYSSYSKYNDNIDRSETWEESVNRVFDNMHGIKFKNELENDSKFIEYYDFAKQKYQDKLVLASQRSLQFGGEPILKHNSKMFNCLTSYCDRPKFFQESMYWLLSGCGVGFSVQKNHIFKLPKLRERSNRSKVFVIEDTIEGWSDAIGVLISSFLDGEVPFPKYQNCFVSFDYTQIRPKGSFITGGFKAPGHEGLRNSIIKIEDLLEKELNKPNFDGTIESIIAYDIVMHLSDAVLSGGVRRSATICLFSPDDEKMLKAKSGNWFMNNPQRARSNNTVLLNRNTVTKEEFHKFYEQTKTNGEPGFGFTDSEDIIYNPCVSEDTFVMTSEGSIQVKNLIGKKFKAVVNGNEYESTSNGFWKTGTKQLFKLKTDKGFELKLTDNHKLLTLDNNIEIWKELSEIKINDLIILNKNKNYSWGEDVISESEKGWLLGNLIGDGTFEDNAAILRYWNNDNSKDSAIRFLENNFKTYKNFTGSEFENVVSISSRKLLEFSKLFNVDRSNKTPNSFIEQQSSKFYEGFIAGLFDADGCVEGNQKKGVSVRLTQANLELLQIVQRMLLRLGIVSKIYNNRNKEGYRLLPDTNKILKPYYCKEVHELIISKENIKTFSERISLQSNDKKNNLFTLLSNYKRKLNIEKFYDNVISIEKDEVEDVYDVTIDDVHCFDANGIIAHNCFEIGMRPQTIDGVSGWQGCVSYNTKLITKSSIEEIGEVAENNRVVEIWNGSKWCNVTPIKTGINRDLYRVIFSDGSYLDCTENHKFMVKNRFNKTFYEIEANKINELLKESKYGLQIPSSNVIYDDTLNNVEYAYEYGFILGDGTVGHRANGKNRIPFAELYEGSKDETLGLRGQLGDISINENNIKFRRIYFNDVDCDFSNTLKYSYGLPKDIFTWSRKSIIDFIAGWIDADGSKTISGCRIYGKEDKLRDCQLLLTKLGIKSSINLASKKGVITNFAVRKNNLWYIQISDTKDLYSNRMLLESKEIKGKGKTQLIKSITKLDGLHDSYCFEEPETHNGLFANVLTKQCNLVEINGGQCDTKEKFFEACKAGAIIGTMQAAYTDFKYVDNITKQIFDREALLGCSITGLMNNPDILLNPEIQKEGARIIKEINKEVAKMIGINQAARTTCVKPSGNASVLLSTASGIHGEHSKNYIRNVQANKEDDFAKYFKEVNPKMVEDSVWSASGTDWVISFPIIANDGSIFKDQLHGTKLLEFVKLTQQNWVEEGTNVDLCTDKNIRHNVSNTIIVDDWDKVEDYIFENKKYFAGISLLPMTGDKDYNQAPFTSILTPSELVKKYGDAAVFASGLIVDGLSAFNNNLWLACETVLGIGEKLEHTEKEVNDKIRFSTPKELWENLGFKNGTLQVLVDNKIRPEMEEYKRYLDKKLVGTVHNYVHKLDWVRRAKQFTDRHFNGINVDMTYCLKDVHNYHRWVEINRDINLIDWTTLKIKPKFTDIDTTGAVSCSGGACEII